MKDCIHSEEEIEALLAQLPNLEEVSWVQEEPKNQGAWLYVYPYVKVLVADKYDLSYHGRIQRAAPAEGDGEIHKLVQNKIIENALKITRGNKSCQRLKFQN